MLAEVSILSMETKGARLLVFTSSKCTYILSFFSTDEEQGAKSKDDCAHRIGLFAVLSAWLPCNELYLHEYDTPTHLVQRLVFGPHLVKIRETSLYRESGLCAFSLFLLPLFSSSSLSDKNGLSLYLLLPFGTKNEEDFEVESRSFYLSLTAKRNKQSFPFFSFPRALLATQGWCASKKRIEQDKMNERGGERGSERRVSKPFSSDQSTFSLSPAAVHCFVCAQFLPAGYV